MSMLKNISKIIAGGALAAAVTTSAYAADHLKVTIPVQTQWGDATLPAGQYDVSSSNTGTPFLSLTGNGKTVYVLASAVDENSSAVDQLRLVNGTDQVQEFSSAELGKTFRFPVSEKALRRTMAFKVKKESAAH